MTLGVDLVQRQEIASQSREYGRSAWPDGGAFNEAKNVSVGGNTVWVVRQDEDGAATGVRSVALGECDPVKGYTGPLSNGHNVRVKYSVGSVEQAVLHASTPLTGRPVCSRERALRRHGLRSSGVLVRLRLAQPRGLTGAV